MRAGAQVQWPKPGRAIITLMVLNLVLYVVELIMIRAEIGEVLTWFGLSPRSVFEKGWIWQIVTYMGLHDPARPGHLLFNLFFLWMFGSPMEKWWGPKRTYLAYFVCGVGGALLTLLLALFSRLESLTPLLANFYATSHVGASGAVMGLTIAWGITFAEQKMHFLFLGEMKGKTFVLIIVAFELLVALSMSQGTSSSAHFGGMIASAILCKGLWRPSRWGQMFKRTKLQRKRKKLEHELKIIEGGKNKGPSDPSKWN